MFGAPSIVSVVDLAAIIAALFIVQWLKEAGEGLSIPHRARGVKQEADNNPPAAYLTGQEYFGNIF